MIFLPVILVFLAGLALSSRIKEPCSRLAFSWGIGVSVFTLFAACVVVSTGDFIPREVQGFSVLAGVLFLFFFIKHISGARLSLSAVLLWLLACSVAAWIWSMHPYGEWDSWSLWQVRSKFLFEAPDRWREILSMDYQEAHPWLLPFFTIWGWAVSRMDGFAVTSLFAVITCAALLLLLFGGMGGRGFFAWMAAGLLALHPSFWWMGTAQYADVWVAFYILAAAVMILSSDGDRRGAAHMAGFFLGCAAALKIDGMLAAALFLIFFLMYALHSAAWRDVFTPLLSGFSLMLPLALLPLAGGSWPGGSLALLDPGNILLPERWQIVTAHFFLVLSAEGDLIIFSVLLAGMAGLYVYRDHAQAFFLAAALFAYVISLFFFFLMTSSPLEWHLNVACARLLFEIRPAVFFVTFFILRRLHDRTARSH